jgi:hypothetical protein
MQIRYAVAGAPIAHSLSPVLAALTAGHLKQAELSVDLGDICLLNAEDVTSPMAWAWTDRSRKRQGVSSRLFGDPSQSASRLRLHRVANTVLNSVDVADPDHVPEGETLLAPDEERLKIRRGESEAWISLTSPLKHQLRPRSGVLPIDDSLENGAVNQLRWDGMNWHCAGTDGSGLIALARHFGFDFEAEGTESPLLCLVGGGGAARAAAAAWAAEGGTIWAMGGRRPLDNRGPWVDVMIDGEEVAEQVGPRFHVDFDQTLGDPPLNGVSDADIHLISAYDSMDCSRIIERTENGLRLDGRWLLVAQHLDAWARLYCPEAAHLLPGLGLTMTRLIAAESALRAD